MCKNLPSSGQILVCNNFSPPDFEFEIALQWFVHITQNTSPAFFIGLFKKVPYHIPITKYRAGLSKSGLRNIVVQHFWSMYIVWIRHFFGWKKKNILYYSLIYYGQCMKHKSRQILHTEPLKKSVQTVTKVNFYIRKKTWLQYIWPAFVMISTK